MEINKLDLHSIDIERNGEKYYGHYQVRGDVLTVYYKDKSNPEKLGSFDGDIEALAKLMLSEMIEDK